MSNTTLGQGSWVYKKAVWESHGQQASEQCFFVVSASVPASQFHPSVCTDFPQWSTRINYECKYDIDIFLSMLDSFMPTWHKLELSERREPQLRKHLHKIQLWGILLVINEGRSRGSTPGLVVLGSIKKQAEEAMETKTVSSIPPWPLHQFPSPGSCPVWVLALTSFNDKQCCRSVSQKVLSSPSYFGYAVLSKH